MNIEFAAAGCVNWTYGPVAISVSERRPCDSPARVHLVRSGPMIVPLIVAFSASNSTYGRVAPFGKAAGAAMAVGGLVVIRPATRALVLINIAKNIRLALRTDLMKVPIMINLSSLLNLRKGVVLWNWPIQNTLKDIVHSIKVIVAICAARPGILFFG